MLFDKTQIAEIYERTYSKVYNYFYYITMSKERTEDLTSKTYIRFLEKYDLYDPKRGGVSTWIMGIAHNIWNDEYRKNAKYRFTQIDDVEEGAMKQEPVELEQLETKMVVEALLGCLSDREREIVGMRYKMELSYNEIARITGITEKNVSVILSRSLKKMNVVLEG